MTRVLHCITGLSGDGAQRMLLRLTQGLARKGMQNVVVSLNGREVLAEEFERNGVEVCSMGMTKGLGGLSDIRRLRAFIAGSKCDVVQTWMYHANMAIALANIPSLGIPVVWNIRRGLDDLSEIKLSTRFVIYASGVVSRAATKIVYSNPLSADQHERLGFPVDKRVVIENGFDTAGFHPRGDARAKLMHELQFPDNAVLIGNVGRYDVAKAQELLVEAFARLIFTNPEARLILIGRGMDSNNRTLVRLINQRGISSRVYLLGERSRLEEIYPAFDVYCSSSIAEGFPNAVAEAMASGVPCVVTDTGASRQLNEGLGEVVPTRSLTDLSDALSRVLSLSSSQRSELGARSRDRIVSDYSLAGIVERYATLYNSLAKPISFQEAA